MSQHYACLGSELGIQPQYLDCERYLVDDALTGTVTTAEKFQIFDRVVLPVSVDVVDGFIGQKRPLQMLFHHPSMFKHFSFLAAGNVGWEAVVK